MIEYKVQLPDVDYIPWTLQWHLIYIKYILYNYTVYHLPFTFLHLHLLCTNIKYKILRPFGGSRSETPVEKGDCIVSPWRSLPGSAPTPSTLTLFPFFNIIRGSFTYYGILRPTNLIPLFVTPSDPSFSPNRNNQTLCAAQPQTT